MSTAVFQPNAYQTQDQSAERYARKVIRYSKLDTFDAYLSGKHYNRLGKFLISPYQSYGDEFSIDIPEYDFNFVTICDLGRKRQDPAHTRLFCRPDEFTKYLEHPDHNAISEVIAEDSQNSAHGSDSELIKQPVQSIRDAPLKPKQSGIMVFLRGFPSPQWLNHLGSALDIDPEFFSRHLDVSPGLISDASQKDSSYVIPSPKTTDLIELRICNTGSWSTTSPGTNLATLRKSCKASLSSHLDDFLHWRNIAVGDSVVRRFIVQDQHNFAIEQRISIEVVYHTRRWSSRSEPLQL